jgi:hypothetical protein
VRREVAGAVVFEDPTAYDDVADTLVRLLGQDLVIPATAAAVTAASLVAATEDASPQAWRWRLNSRFAPAARWGKLVPAEEGPWRR